MARRQVVEVHCDRCGRLENQVPEKTGVQPEELRVSFQGKTIVYQDLCQSCRKAIVNYVQKLEYNRGEKKDDLV